MRSFLRARRAACASGCVQHFARVLTDADLQREEEKGIKELAAILIVVPAPASSAFQRLA